MVLSKGNVVCSDLGKKIYLPHYRKTKQNKTQQKRNLHSESVRETEDSTTTFLKKNCFQVSLMLTLVGYNNRVGCYQTILVTDIFMCVDCIGLVGESVQNGYSHWLSIEYISNLNYSMILCLYLTLL